MDDKYLIEYYTERCADFEDLLVELVGYFKPGNQTSNSIFEGGKVILDIEVDDEVEDILDRIEVILNEAYPEDLVPVDYVNED